MTALVAGVALAVYLATMYPGLLDIGDAAKFSFVGKVLGTPHAPGYPLYTLVSHGFSYVPWGTLAHRMNGLSALFGALAVALVYRIGRRLGAGRMAAASGALACGLGFAFWSKASYAKGYTLNAALVAGGILALVRWDESRTLRDFYWAVAIFAVSIGNHLTVIALLPALVLFALVTDARTVLRPRTLLVASAIVLLGFTQYGLIIVRTLQDAPYLEARATGLGELWSVMTARRFAHEIGAFSWSALFATRVPIVCGLIARELGVVGLTLSAAGFLLLLRRRVRVAVLFGLGAAGVAALTANMGSSEDEGFLLAAFVLLGSLTSVGLDWVVGALRRLPPLGASTLIVVAAALPPGVQFATNIRSHNHSADNFEIAYFDALFAALPQKATVVAEDYRIDMMVLYKLLGEGAAGSRDIRLVQAEVDAVSRYHEAGYDVVAFPEGKRRLAEAGVRFVPHEAFAQQQGGQALVVRRELYRLLSIGTCVGIANSGWVDVSKQAQQRGRLSFKIDDVQPFDSRVTVYAAHDMPLTPAVMGLGGAGSPTLSSEVYRRDDDPAETRLASRLAADAVTLPPAALKAAYLTRAEVRVNDKGAFATYTIDFGETPRLTLARAIVDRDNPDRATVCSYELGATDAWPADSRILAIAPDAVNVVYGSGWHSVERRPDGTPYRWTTASAELIIPIGSPRAASVTMAGEPYVRPGNLARSVDLVVNGHPIGNQAVTSTPGTRVWTVPQEYWRAGLNALVFNVKGAGRPSDDGSSTDSRLLGMAVSSIEITEAPGAVAGQRSLDRVNAARARGGPRPVGR